MHTLKERALHPLRRNTYTRFSALRDVSFEVSKGQFYGIVGRNGSGKSTLLKCLAGILKADSGEIRTSGRISTFIELGVGFNQDLAAYDNVILNGTMLGLTRRESKRRYDSIIDFAELRDFSELKLKNYSSGMLVRLAFSVMIQVDADVLLIDEVLAVGDAAFQQKCFDELEAIREANKTVLLVSHDMSAVRRFCDEALLLETGSVVSEGEPEIATNRYLDINFSPRARADAAADETAVTIPPQAEGEVFGDGRATILEAWLEDAGGERVSILHSGERYSFNMRVRFNEPVSNPVFAVGMQNSARIELLTAASDWDGSESGVFEPGSEVAWRIDFENVLGPDRYTVRPSVGLGGGASLAVHERMLSVVSTRSEPGGLVTMPFEQSLERVAGNLVDETPAA